MISAVVGRKGGLELIEIPKPKPEKGEIVVEMKACGICGTDLEKIGVGTETPPVLGHEVVGVVSDIGGELDENIEIGERVFTHHHVACGKCWYCYNGSETMCDLFKKTNIWPGGFSEYFKVPKTNIERGALHRIPSNMGWVKATFIEPLATVIRAVNRSSIKPGYRIAIVGSGPMGMLFINYLNSLGVEEILAVDISNYRCRKAEELGASKCIHPKEIDDQNYRADVAIQATGSIKALETSFKLTRKGGEILLFGAPPPKAKAEVPLSKIFYEEIKITPSYSTTEKEIEIALKILNKNIIEIDKIVTHIYTLKNIRKAFETALKSDKALKIIIVKDKNSIEPELQDRFIE